MTFVPDRAKGNAADDEPVGTVDADGHYTLYTKARRAARPAGTRWSSPASATPPGRVEGPPDPAARGEVRGPGPVRPGRRRPLEVEVVASPPARAYDLNLKP